MKRSEVILSARQRRSSPSPAEEVLWAALRNCQVFGLKFYRQKVIGPFIADFYCAFARLVIEVDGDIHNYQREYDADRTVRLEDYGYQVIRFQNEMVLSDIDSVLFKIKEAALARTPNLTPQPPPLKSGEGAGGEVDVDQADLARNLTQQSLPNASGTRAGSEVDVIQGDSAGSFIEKSLSDASGMSTEGEVDLIQADLTGNQIHHSLPPDSGMGAGSW